MRQIQKPALLICIRKIDGFKPYTVTIGLVPCAIIKSTRKRIVEKSHVFAYHKCDLERQFFANADYIDVNNEDRRIQFKNYG